MENTFRKFNINEDIIKTIEKLGYLAPTEVQVKVIPAALESKDIIVKSQTGSGKTAAFGIPICEKVELERNKPQALILTPTRELCVQIKEDISNIGRFKRIRATAIFGKQPFSIQAKELKQRVHVVVGTPGRTMDHIERGTLEIDEIKYLIIDEADEMLNMGFIDQVEAIIKKLPKDRITMLFSATMSKPIEALSQKYMLDPIIIEITPDSLTVDTIDQVVYEVDEEEKYKLLKHLIYVEHPDSCIIFCRTKDNVDKLVRKLSEKGFSCDGLHGGMLQNDRLSAIKRFKQGEFNILVATDVAARGIDIEDVTHIFNYDVPLEKESYVHRIGRTGRAGKDGKAITLVTPFEKRFLREIEDYVGYKITKAEAPSKEEVEVAKITFSETVKVQQKPKAEKGEALNEEIVKIYINAGKKKKVRPGDIVGAITSIEGITPEHIGIIDIQDNISYVDILDGQGYKVLKALKQMTIKGKKMKVQRAAK